jgi:hypothetical protein
LRPTSYKPSSEEATSKDYQVIDGTRATPEQAMGLLVGVVVDFPNGSPHLVEITQLPCLGPEGSVWPADRVAAPANSAREKLNPVQGTANLAPTRLVRWDSGS